MKEVLIVYKAEKNLADLAQGLKEGFVEEGARVELEKAGQKEQPVSLASYDLVLFGSPVLGFFGGKIDNSIKKFLEDSKAVSGQKVVAFVNSTLFGTNKAVKQLMEQLEKEGCLVYDFRALEDKKAAKDYAQKINLEN